MMAKSSDKLKDTFCYRDGLSDCEKVRYDDKLKLLGGNDPYEIKSWSTDVSLLPPVTYIDIVNYLLWTPSVYTKDELKSYKGLDAYNQFVNGWVRDRSAVECNGYTVVTAKVLHSQRMREKPLRPWIIANKDGTLLGAHCNCMAGLGEACTHIAALLFAIDATVRIRDSKTVTDEKAYWLLPSAMKAVEYKEVQEIDFTSAASAKRKFDFALEAATSSDNTNTPKTPRQRTPGCNPKAERVPEASDDDMDSLFSILHDGGSKAVILAVVEPYCDQFIPKVISEDFPQILTELKDDKCLEMNYKELTEHCLLINVECTQNQRDAVEIASREQSNSKFWNVFRAGRITASRAKAVCATDEANPSQSLIKSICYPDSVKFKSKATRWGCDHEKIAREQFGEIMATLHENGRLEDSGFIISTENPYIGASPDGIFSCDCCGSTTIEIKCPYCAKDDITKCDYLIEINGVNQLNPKHDYYYQVQTQLGCSNNDSGYFIVWTEKEIHVEEILFDIDTWKEISEKGKHLFDCAILPELVGKFYSRAPVTYSKDVLSVRTDNNTTPATVSTVTTHSNVPDKPAEKLYCYCSQVEHGRMIACDNQNCPIEWFHYPCVKVEKGPRGKWYCPDCRKLPEFKRKRHCTKNK